MAPRAASQKTGPGAAIVAPFALPEIFCEISGGVSSVVLLGVTTT